MPISEETLYNNTVNNPLISVNRSVPLLKMENSNPRDRLYLNFGNNDPKFQADTRTYPTTPSTFPNPIFQGQAQGGQQHAQGSQQPYSTGFAPAGYFMNNPYPPTYPQQPPSTYQQAPAPQASYQQRPAAPISDATNGLVHQFSHQNLGGASRASPYGSRQPSPSQRPRTAGATGQQAGYGSYLNAPMPSQTSQQQAWPEFQTAPERNPEKYGSLAVANQTKCRGLAETFFKDSVKRARDRNLRSVILYSRLQFEVGITNTHL